VREVYVEAKSSFTAVANPNLRGKVKKRIVGGRVSYAHMPSRCIGKFVAPENYSHTQQYGLGLRLRIGLNLGLGLRLGLRLTLGLGLGVGLRLGFGLGLALAEGDGDSSVAIA